MLHIDHVHHVAIICSDYRASRRFVRESYRVERKSYKLDLRLGDQYIIELLVRQ